MYLQVFVSQQYIFSGDNSNNKKRRRWNDVDRLSKPIFDEQEAQRIKDGLAEREDKRTLAKEQGEKYIEDNSDQYLRRGFISLLNYFIELGS